MDRLPIVVNLLKGEDAPRWDDFVRRCPQATFFHLSAWRDLMEEVFDHRTFYLYAERAGDIVGVLPLAEVRSRLFGHALVSLPFCVYGGIATAEDAGPETLHALESKAETLARALGVQHLEYRNLQPRHEDWPRQAELYVTFRKEILPEVEANLLAIPRKQRAMVRKGIKNALVSEVDDTVDRFFALYADNVLRHGTPALPKRFFEQLKERFGEACERGCKVFDYGRSKVGTGPYAFKKNWGFEPQPLSYEYRLYKRDSIPQNNPMNPKYRAFIALWKRLPIGVANRLGPHIVRNLG